MVMKGISLKQKMYEKTYETELF